MTVCFNIDGNGEIRAYCPDCGWTTPVSDDSALVRRAADRHSCRPNWSSGPGNLQPIGIETLHHTTERTPTVTASSDETVPVSLDLLLRVDDLLRTEGHEEISDDLRAALPASPVTAALDALRPLLDDARSRPDVNVPSDFVRDVLTALDDAGLLRDDPEETHRQAREINDLRSALTELSSAPVVDGSDPDGPDLDPDVHPDRRKPRPGDTWLAEYNGEFCVAIRNSDRDGNLPWTGQLFYSSSAAYFEAHELDFLRPLRLA